MEDSSTARETGLITVQPETQPTNVILFPLPLQGHINPMLQLAHILYSHGFSITIIHTQFNSPTPSKHPHYTFVSISDGSLDADRDMATSDVVAFLSALNSRCVEPFRECLSRLLTNVREDRRPQCLITDAVWHFTQKVADELKIPRVVLRTSSISAFLALTKLLLLRDKGYITSQDNSTMEGLVPEIPPLTVKDIPTIVTTDVEDLFQLVTNMVAATKASSGLIFNTLLELEEDFISQCAQEIPIPTFPIGPFHKYFLASSTSLLAQDRTSISWLDKQPPKSVIYVSFGSVASIDETEFLEIAWGLANCGRSFLWAVRSGSVRGSEWLGLLPDEVMTLLNNSTGHIVKWAPQQEVLGHPSTGAFWTHCGWNSTLESICEGVPMICRPFFGDQRVNGRYVSNVWRIGLHLEHKVERKEIESAIRRLVVDEEGEEMRKRIKVLKERVDGCIMEGGSSSTSLANLVHYLRSL